MTRDEFIDGYMARSKLSPDLRTSVGYTFKNFVYEALPCACGDSSCDGWAMVSTELKDTHMQLYAPQQDC